MEYYEQRYKEIIEKIKEAKESMGGYTFSSVVDKIIPELKESEDDKIRKGLLKIFREAQPTNNWGGLSTKDIIAWLEKQGEKKSWSEEDERIKTTIIKLLGFVRDTYHQYSDECNESIDWLKKQSNKDTIEHIFHELKDGEDERIRKSLIGHLKECRNNTRSEVMIAEYAKWITWLEKQDPKKHEEELERAYKCADEVQYRKGYEDAKREFEKQGEKIDVIENFDTEFEKQVSHLIASAINKEHEYNQGYIKWAANALLNYAKHELEKQDEHKCDWKYII